MGKSRNLADVLDVSGDVTVTALDNIPDTGRIIGFQNFVIGGSATIVGGVQSEFSLLTVSYTPKQAGSFIWINASIPVQSNTSENHSMLVRTSINVIQDGVTYSGSEDALSGGREGYSGGPWPTWFYDSLCMNRTMTPYSANPITIDIRAQQYHGGTNTGSATYFSTNTSGNIIVLEYVAQ